MALPRLSGALRVFSSVSAEGNVQHPAQLDDLKRKRRRRAEQEQSNILTWSALVSTINRQAGHVPPHQVSDALRDLIHLTSQIAGDGRPSSDLEAGAALIFQIFATVDNVGPKQTSHLRRIFGPFPASAATSACQKVQQLVSWLKDDILEQLLDSSLENSKPAAAEFGKKKKFISPGMESVDDDELAWLESESEDESVEADFIASKHTRGEDDGIAGAKAVYGASWLRQQVEKHFGSRDSALGISVVDMCSTIFDTLNSQRPDSELQNELFELLGDDRFELIESLLQNRQEIISVMKESASDLMSGRSGVSERSRPQYGCQVTVQSEQEKQLRRQFRREDKRANRKKKKVPTATLR